MSSAVVEAPTERQQQLNLQRQLEADDAPTLSPVVPKPYFSSDNVKAFIQAKIQAPSITV